MGAVKKNIYFLKLFIFFSLTLLPSILFSNISKECVHLIRDFNKKAHQSYISLITLIEIPKIFSGTETSHLKAKKLFNVVLSERLRNLSPDIKKKVEELLKKRVISNKETPLTYYNQETDTIYLQNDFPNVEPNYIYYASFIHEVEHAVQNYLLQEKFPKAKEELDSVELRTQQEIGAMFLEYDFIRLVPKDEKKIALEEAEKNITPQISEADKKYFKTLLSENYSKPIEYIKANQREGRYSVESIERFFESFGH